MKRLALLVFFAVLVAGCTSFQTNGDDKPKRIEISGPTCTVNGQPCSSVQLTEFDQPRIVLSVANNGESPVEVMMEGGESDSNVDGSQVMVSDCNIYTLGGEGFIAKQRSLSGVEEVAGQESVTLGEDETLELIWNMELADVDVSRLGYTCPLGFALTFDQELETTRQVQVKSSDDIPDATGLQTSTTSRWPVRLRIESEQHVIRPGDEERPFVARAYLQNMGNGEVNSIGSESLDSDIGLNFSQGGASSDCTGKTDIRMYGAGERAGQSFREVCSFTPSTVENSEFHTLTASTEYRYRVDLSPVELSVVPVEGG